MSEWGVASQHVRPTSCSCSRKEAAFFGARLILTYSQYSVSMSVSVPPSIYAVSKHIYTFNLKVRTCCFSGLLGLSGHLTQDLMSNSDLLVFFFLFIQVEYHQSPYGFLELLHLSLKHQRKTFLIRWIFSPSPERLVQQFCVELLKMVLTVRVF